MSVPRKNYYKKPVQDTSGPWRGRYRVPMSDSPTEIALRAGPCGDAKWPSWGLVYLKIAAACEKMGASSAHLSEDHINSMADLGSGHEERMKYRQMWLRAYGWLTPEMEAAAQARLLELDGPMEDGGAK